jgi:capsular exopolysaccharide synthesis family protein
MSSVDPFAQSDGRAVRLHAVPANRRILRDAIDTGVLGGPTPFSLNLREILDTLYRNRWLFIVILPLSLLAGILIAKMATPKYDAVASVQIDQQATHVLEGNGIEPNVDFQDADRFLKTQLDILSSRAMAERVAQNEHLFGDPSFFHQMGARFPDKPAGGMTLGDTRDDAVIALLRSNFGSDLPRDSRVVTIRFRSPTPQLAARIANAFATNFIRGNLDRKLESTSYARDLLSGQLAQAKNRLEISERQLNDYARSASLIDTSLPSSNSNAIGARSVTTASLVALNEAYVAAEAERVQRQQRWQTAMRTSADNMGEVLGNQAIQALLEQRAEKTAALAEEQKRRKDDYPTVVQAKAELAELNQQINSIGGSIRKSVQDQYLTALHQEQDLGSRVQALKAATLSEQDRSVQYNILKREVDTNRTLFDGFLQRYKELSAAANVASNNLSIVDTAGEPTRPSTPRLTLVLAISLFLGGGLACAIMMVREMLDESVHSPTDVENMLNLSVLGAIPLAAKGSDMEAQIIRPDAPLSEAYASLLVSLGLDSRQGLPRSICVTSSEPGEGKTTTAYAIAYGLARRGIKVLLVDADLRRPRLHQQTGISNECGFSDVLLSRIDLASAVSASNQAGLDILTSGPLPANPSELLSGGGLARALEQAMKSYTVVILDASPVLGLADAITLARSTAATIFVVGAGQAAQRRANNALGRLRGAQAHIIGAVLTKFNPGRFGPYGEYSGNYFTYRLSA